MCIQIEGSGLLRVLLGVLIGVLLNAYALQHTRKAKNYLSFYCVKWFRNNVDFSFELNNASKQLIGRNTQRGV